MRRGIAEFRGNQCMQGNASVLPKGNEGSVGGVPLFEHRYESERAPRGSGPIDNNPGRASSHSVEPEQQPFNLIESFAKF